MHILSDTWESQGERDSISLLNGIDGKSESEIIDHIMALLRTLRSSSLSALEFELLTRWMKNSANS